MATLYGNSSNNSLVGTEVNDRLFGRDGNDSLFGEEGNDYPMKPNDCLAYRAVRKISGKWKLLILYQLRSGTKRFNVLRRSIIGVSQRILILQLRELEKEGLVNRRVYAEVPPKVEYSLTKLGETIVDLLDRFAKLVLDTE